MPQDHPSQDHAFFATCPRNTEGLLLGELRALGAGEAAETRAGVSFPGPLVLAYRACLWSRVASRVVMRIASFAAASVDDLYEGISTIAWEDHLAPHGTLAVEVTSRIRQGPLARLNTHFAEQRVKDAVVDRFRARCGTRPGVDLLRPDLRINLHLAQGEAVVGLDLSGDGLHRRGYRLGAGEAPLKENLAAAVLMRAGWPRIAAAGGALLDPLCGSGTLLIEGALMAGDVAPGLQRDYFGFLRWSGFDPQIWSGLLEEAEERRAAGLSRLPPLLGFDSDPRAIGAARANARRAGLAGRIVLERRALASLITPERGFRPPSVTPSAPVKPGLVIANPPYGKRLGDVPDLVELYETLGGRLKASFSGWEAGVLTGNPELGAHLGLRAHRANVLYNGPILCRLLLFHIDPEAFQAPIVRAPASSAATEHPHRPPSPSLSDDTPGAVMFGNRLRKNLRHLRRWAARENIRCYRVYDADLPEYAAAIDLYHDWVQIQEYAPPSTVDPVRARRRIKEVMTVIPQVLEIPPEQAVLKTRRPQRGAEQYRKLESEGRLLEVEEGGLRFLVNLTGYLDTGLFLDHRLTRKLIQDLAQGRRFLNLFAYTGAATVYAAAGGAVSTTSVDLSITYLDWARRNLDLNGFSGPQHGFVRADCLAWLAQARSAGRLDAARPSAGGPSAAGPYDLIFLDAPTFSNSKSMTTTLDIQRDHPGLVGAAMDLLAPGGILLFSTNFRRFNLDPALADKYEVTDITSQTIPPDFARNPRIHACYRLTSARPPRRDRSAQAGKRSSPEPGAKHPAGRSKGRNGG
jgi:23S rRNA (guanine2445-N2)-methyltransferase / 23S rRNA (guanine2069-N7)-methyltransferase